MVATIRYGPDEPDGSDNFDEYFTFTDLFTFSRIAAPPFHARGCFWHLGNVIVSEHVMGPVRADRDIAALMRAPADHLTLLVMVEGELVFEAERHETARAGDVVLFDYRRSCAYQTPGHTGATISFPRALMEDRLGPTIDHGVVAASAETRLFADVMRSLVMQLPELDDRNVPPVVTMIMQIVAAVLAHQSRPTALNSARSRAHAYIEAQEPGTICADQMAIALGMSRSKLYRLFESDGGMHAYDRRRRLHQLHLALLQEAMTTPLSSLGMRFGFLDPSALSRQFRAQFGYSMRDVRKHSVRGQGEGSVPALQQFREAMARLT